MSANNAIVDAGMNSAAVWVIRTVTLPGNEPRNAEMYIGSRATAAEPLAPISRRALGEGFSDMGPVWAVAAGAG
ncbi:hypothetical protein GCM10022380_64890 [Amycolatopsis tucumanensis]|uniref:Uncharacterized protein n=1 Tax=Amycolatopsis tucumanensis TaxID=401106 RepID=A0ABP7JA79_9PSEU